MKYWKYREKIHLYGEASLKSRHIFKPHTAYIKANDIKWRENLADQVDIG